MLKADYVVDDANTYNAAGAAGSIFAGLSVTFDNGAQFYNVEFPDRISPLGGATSALTYATGGPPERADRAKIPLYLASWRRGGSIKQKKGCPTGSPVVLVRSALISGAR